MWRSILAIISGPGIYGLVCLPVNHLVMVMMPGLVNKDGTSENVFVLILYLLLHVLYCALAGFATALIAGKEEIKHGFAQMMLLLSISVFVQVQFWDLMPVWYHISFFIFTAPGVFLGVHMRLSQGTDVFQS